MKNHSRILIYGYGNPGRKDDGLGPAFAEMTGNWARQNNLVNVDIDSNYQLNIEDAYNIQDYDIVVFADASREEIDHFIIDRVTPSEKVSFNTHSASPGFVLNLCQELYKKEPMVFLLHIKGYEYSMNEGFSPLAQENLEQAFEFLKDAIAKPEKFSNLVPVIR